MVVPACSTLLALARGCLLPSFFMFPTSPREMLKAVISKMSLDEMCSCPKARPSASFPDESEMMHKDVPLVRVK